MWATIGHSSQCHCLLIIKKMTKMNRISGMFEYALNSLKINFVTQKQKIVASSKPRRSKLILLQGGETQEVSKHVMCIH